MNERIALLADVITSRYGTDALAVLRTTVAAAKSEDPLAPVTVVVPNNIAGIVARRHLAAGLVDGGNGVAGLNVVTLPRLAEQLAASTLAPRRPATSAVVASAWRAVLRTDPGSFDRVREHPATVRALVKAHRDLRQLSTAALQAVAATGPLAADVVRLHQDVIQRLQNSWYDEVDLLRAVPTSSPSLVELGHVVLYLPQVLSPAAQQLVAYLCQETSMTVIIGETGNAKADQAVHRDLSGMGITVPGGGVPEPMATRVLHASDSDDEVRCVIRRVTNDLEQTPAHRIAILYTTTSPYARLLHEQLDAAEITYNGPGSSSVRDRAFPRAFLQLLTLVADDVPRRALFLALAEAPTLQFTGDPVPVSRWERISRLAGVVGGNDWTQRLDDLIAKERRRLEELESEQDTNQAAVDATRHRVDDATGLQRFATALHDRLAAGSAITTWSSLSAWALDLLTDLYGETDDMRRLPIREQYAAVALTSSLRGLATLDAFEPDSASLPALAEIVSEELDASLPRSGRFGEGVFVGPLSSAPGLDADVVYVLGMAEDAYPGRISDDSLLPDGARVATDGELLTARERVHVKQAHWLAALQAGHDVTACFPRGDLRRSAQRLPSRFLLPTLRALNGEPSLTATSWDTVQSPSVINSASYAAELDQSRSLATEQEWRIRRLRSSGDLDDVTVTAAHHLLSERTSRRFTRFDGNLEGNDHLPDYASDGRLVSPTMLEAYAVCPHAFFVNRLLRVEPLEHPEEIISISPLEIGNLIHYAMDQFVSEHEEALPGYGEPWAEDHRARLRQIADALCDHFVLRGVTGHPKLWARERRRIQRDLELMIDNDNEWRATRDARVVQSEMKFGNTTDDAVTIPVANGTVLMRGSADLISETRNGQFLVIDIKAGGFSRFTSIDNDPVVAGTKLQLPVYGHAVEQAKGAAQVEALYWFVRRGHRRIGLELTDELKEMYAQTISTLVDSIANGQFPTKPPDTPDYGWVLCAYCNADRLGHGEARERWERKRYDPVLAELVTLIEPDAAAEGAS